MARHRSPHGRRAHPQPLVEGALAVAIPHVHVAPGFAEGEAKPWRLVALVVAGTTVAASGHQLLVQAAPMVSDGTTALRTAMGDVFGPDRVAGIAAPEQVASIAAAQPLVVDATGLVKAADMQAAAAVRAAEEARLAEQARVAEEARRVEEARVAAEAQVVREREAQAAREAEVARRAEEAAKPAPAAVAKPAAAPKAAAPAKPAEPAAPAAPAAKAGSAQLVAGRVSSGFGARGGRQHQGLDIAAPIGTPIHVPLAGTVIDSGPASGFGLWVRVRHADGTITTYGHVNRSLVKVGQRVATGEVIAEVGNRGRSTGPHLHIEVTSPGGKKIDPRPWLRDRGVPV